MKYLKYIPIKILLFLFTSYTHGQDSAQIELGKLEELTRKNMRNPDSLLIYGKQLYELSKKEDYDQGLRSSSRILGFAHARLQNYEKSNNYYYQSLALARKAGDERFEHIVYNDLSINHRNTKFYDSAVFYSRKLIDYYSKTGEIRSLNLAMMNMGISWLSKSKLDSAEVYFKKSVEGFGATKNNMFLSNNLSLLGEVYYQNKMYNNALEAVDSGQVIAKNQNYQQYYARNYSLLARIHEALGNDELSNEYFDLAHKNNPGTIANKSLGDINDTHKKSNYELNRNAVQGLMEEKRFYQSNFFKITSISAFLLVISYVLFRRSSAMKKEVEDLKNKMSMIVQKGEDDTMELLHLKCKVVIDPKSLQYIKSDGHYVEFYLEGKEKPEIDRNSMTNVLEALPKQHFIRIHKSYIINLSYVKLINSSKIMLSNGVWINLSRSYKNHLKEVLQAV